MYPNLVQRLNQLVPLNPQQQRNLCAAIKPVKAVKDEPLLEVGEVSERIYFVEAGVVRSACEVEGKEVTRWFSLPGDFAASYFSFVYRQPSSDRIVAVTDTTLLSLSYGALQDLSKQDSVWIDLNRHLLEYYYTTLLERVLAFQTQSTAERYHSLLKEYPGIEDMIPLGYLASYLGMSQETLSRLRAKRKR